MQNETTTPETTAAAAPPHLVMDDVSGAMVLPPPLTPRERQLLATLHAITLLAQGMTVNLQFTSASGPGGLTRAIDAAMAAARTATTAARGPA